MKHRRERSGRSERPGRWIRLCGAAGALLVVLATAAGGGLPWPFLPAECTVEIRDPSRLGRAQIPDVGPPITIATPRKDLRKESLSLDEAIRVALQNSDVVRILAGVQAASSGSTIYDAPITQTGIDEAKGRFDPQVAIDNLFSRDELPVAQVVTPDMDDPDPFPPFLIVNGRRADNYDLDFGLSKTLMTGGELGLGVRASPTRLRPQLDYEFNPSSRSSLEMSLTQPLLQGGGLRANRVPIVLARIDTERSYFRFKDSVQTMVQGVIEAYWALVFARVDRWAREQQVEQATFAYELSDAQRRTGLRDAGDAAQTQTALANFRATLIAAQANVLDREAALRNILGLPPQTEFELVPISPPSKDELAVDWESVVTMAEERRPDIIELKLIVEADEQLLIQADNQARPRVDGIAIYRWNGLEGEFDGNLVATRYRDSTDWTLGVTFSVPLGLRASRAGLRRQELVIARDRANLDQGMHAMVHSLALAVRNLNQLHARYEAFQEAREAARINLSYQLERYRAGLAIPLELLQAIATWGNAVSSEAQALTLYNSELARLEQETGTILETHGIAFVEERYGSLGPLGRFARNRCYPAAIRPTDNEARYPSGDEPAEESFHLEQPYQRGARTLRPPPRKPELIVPPDQ